jgi:hypothetical protein
MKKLIISAVVLLTAYASLAQSEKYQAAMRSNIAAIDSSFRNPTSLLTLANNFERIATAEKNQWLPYYYAAFLQANYGLMSQEKDKKDMIADKAAALISEADSLSPANSEVSTVKSMIATCRLMVDPMNRYMKYGQESSIELQNAMTQDPNNPRPYLLKGQSLKYTPEQFGGGCGPATEQLQIAVAKFSTFRPASNLHPVWGKEMADRILQECK